MMFGSLKNGGLRLAPKMLFIDGKDVWFPSREQYLTAGYKEIIITDQPETEPGYHAEIGFEETPDTITQTWTIVEGEVISVQEVLDILMGVGE